VIVSAGTTGTSSGTTGTSSTGPATITGVILQLDPVAPPPLNDYITIYDFIEKAPTAFWLTNEHGLQFPGTQEDSRGFALLLHNATLEDNKVYSKVLEMHPPWKTDSMIRGVYNDLLHGDTYTPQAGDHFTAKVGFLKGATSGDVKFKVMIRFDDDRRFTGDEIHKTYDGTLTPIVVPLATYRGKKINIELEVLANNTDAKQDWAVWVDPKITRQY
jgi:hypothetical protein